MISLNAKKVLHSFFILQNVQFSNYDVVIMKHVEFQMFEVLTFLAKPYVVKEVTEARSPAASQRQARLLSVRENLCEFSSQSDLGNNNQFQHQLCFYICLALNYIVDLLFSVTVRKIYEGVLKQNPGIKGNVDYAVTQTLRWEHMEQSSLFKKNHLSGGSYLCLRPTDISVSRHGMARLKKGSISSVRGRIWKQDLIETRKYRSYRENCSHGIT